MFTEAKRRVAFGSLSAVAVALLPTHVVAESSHERAMKTCNEAMVRVLDAPRPDLSGLQPASSTDEPYRLETTDARGEWEFQCDRQTGAPISVEWSGADPATSPLHFALTMPAEEAMAKVKNLHPDSRIEDVSHRVGASGNAYYEFDLTLKDGTRKEIDVDAATGELAAQSQETERSAG